MKYQHEIVINLPRAAVIQKFDSTENMKHWQRGFMGMEPISGNPGEEGAKSTLTYQMGKRKITMIETIAHKNLPEEFHGTYEADGVYNIQENYFEAIDDNATKWISDSEFRFSGFMMKFIGFIMPGAFKRQSYQYMVDFKNFAEKGISVNDS
ncbi:SRPBCC family protein [Leptobacterium sp. I13]|uniref:SRPBCC family protein n=1 Tax=Leptobacterium meishanense TaxID=3128904 RepID=UPI0030EF1353